MCKDNNLFFKVLKLLKEKGLTQTELAKKAGLTQPSLSRILAGKYEIKINNLEKIAKALDVPISYLVSSETQKNSDIDKEKLAIKDQEIKLLKEKIAFLEKQLKLSKK
ncbi:MAG: helix-turn-helix transcriptional regulator [Elusimicrobia bacterium]|nr:helix-turn-helix transcriptional regulator [Elusimicrobiota bacterium]